MHRRGYWLLEVFYFSFLTLQRNVVCVIKKTKKKAKTKKKLKSMNYSKTVSVWAFMVFCLPS